MYRTASSPADAAAYYQEQMAALGWTLLSDFAMADDGMYLEFGRAERRLGVYVNASDGATEVNVILLTSQE